MIKITVVSYDNAAPVRAMSAVFGTERKTFGRSDDNFLVLPDHKHQVSRAQAAVWSDGLQHHLVNLSHATPIRVNGREIEMDTEVAIEFGDLIQVGPYQLRADHDDGGAPTVMLDEAASGEEAPNTRPATAEEEHEMEAAEPDSGDARTLKEAFLRGAGIPVSAISTGLTPEVMEMLGKLMASTLQGSIDLLALRSLAKKEAKADLTMVVLRNNNPLKFFPDSQTVLTQMLRKKMPGFMEPLESVDDAFRDLRGHQLGVLAGVRAGMDALFDQLDPATLSDNLGRSAADLLPMGRKARLWKHYAKQHAALSQKSKGDFQTLFGAPFLDAYEHEVDKFNDGLKDAPRNELRTG